MATLFECDRCKALDRGEGKASRREVVISGGPSRIVCGSCAEAVRTFLAAPDSTVEAGLRAARQAERLRVAGLLREHADRERVPTHYARQLREIAQALETP